MHRVVIDAQLSAALAAVRALGIHPIAGGDGDVIVTDPPAPPAFGDIVVPPGEPTPKTADELLAEAREENARLRGRLEERPAATPPTPPSPPPPLTVAEVERQFAAGEINDTRRIELLTDLRYDERRARERDAERQAQANQRTTQRLNAYVAMYPDLKTNPNSELIQKKLIPKLSELADEGYDPNLASTQVKALDALVADGELAPLRPAAAPTPASPPPADPNEHHRRRIPVGGGAPGAPMPPSTTPEPSRGERLFNKLSPQHQEFYIQYRGSKEAAIKTLEHADEDMLRRNGRLVA